MQDPNNYGNYFLKRKVRDCVTVDHENNDSGYLYCSRKGPRPSHPTTAVALDNILKCVKPGSSVAIIGHGEPGIISTGTGRGPTDKDRHIGFDNIKDWKPLFEPLKDLNLANLYLFGCGTGADQEGAELLFELAQAITATVVSITGDILCDRHYFSLDPKAHWITVDPKNINPPAPVPAVTSPNYEYTQNDIYVQKNNYTRRLFKQDIITVGVKKLPEKPWNNINPDDILNLLSVIDLSNPMNLRGIPNGMLSGVIKITFIHDLETIEKEFYVLNNRLAIDKDAPLLGYYCKNEIGIFFKRLE